MTKLPLKRVVKAKLTEKCVKRATSAPGARALKERPSDTTYTKKYLLGRPPTSEKEINALAYEMLEWCFTDDAEVIEDFPIMKGITPSRFWKLADSNELFAEALEIALEAIGSKLQKGARNRKWDRESIFKVFSQYNGKYKEQLMERFKAEKKESFEKIAVYMDKIKLGESSD